MPASSELVAKKTGEAERKPVSSAHASFETEPHSSSEADDDEVQSHGRLTP